MAMQLEFTKKVAELAKVNETLKREKELALKKHDSLKDKNEFLKQQISKVEKANSRQAQEEPKVSGETTSPVNRCTPFRPYSQPLFVPLFVPSVLPSSDLLQFQNASHPELSGSLEFPMRPDGTPFVYHGQEIHTGNTGSGISVFILPVPWLLPVGHCNTLPTHSQESKRPREASAAHQHGALSSVHHQISSNWCVGMEDSSSSKFVPARTSSGIGLTFQTESGDQCAGHRCDRLVPEVPTGVKSIQNLRPLRSLVDDIDDPRKIYALEHLSQSFSSKKNQERVISNHKKSENVIAANEARQKRKELMRLKNIRFHHSDFLQ